MRRKGANVDLEACRVERTPDRSDISVGEASHRGNFHRKKERDAGFDDQPRGREVFKHVTRAISSVHFADDAAFVAVRFLVGFPRSVEAWRLGRMVRKQTRHPA